MLVLLIVFMVTAPTIQPGVRRGGLAPGEGAKTVPDESGKLIVNVTKDKRVFIGRMEIPFAEVEAKLGANAKLQADHEAYLHSSADTNLTYGDVVKVNGRHQTGGRRQDGAHHRPHGVALMLRLKAAFVRWAAEACGEASPRPRLSMSACSP